MKKKITAVMLALCSMYGCMTMSANAASVKLGDANADGVVNAKDATTILSYYSSNMVGKTFNGNIVDAAADVNTDGTINAKDASAILSEYAKTLVTKDYKPFDDKTATEPETIPETTTNEVVAEATIKTDVESLEDILSKVNKTKIIALVDDYAQNEPATVKVEKTATGRIIATITLKDSEIVINISETEFNKLLAQK